MITLKPHHEFILPPTTECLEAGTIYEQIFLEKYKKSIEYTYIVGQLTHPSLRKHRPETIDEVANRMFKESQENELKKIKARKPKRKKNKFKFVIRCELCNRQFIDSIDCNFVIKPIYNHTMHICDTCFSNKVINRKTSNFPKRKRLFYSTPNPESKFRFVDEISND